MVQKILIFVCPKIGLEVGKVLNRLTETKKEMWQIRWHRKDTKKFFVVVVLM